MKADARKEEYDHVELFGKPALFTDARISRFTVPQGWFCYDLRGSDYDPGNPIMVEDHVVVNHAGTILTPTDLKLDKRKEHRRKIGDGLNFLGESLTLEQFCEEHGLDYPADTRKYLPHPASRSEAGMFYAHSQEENEALGSIGHLRMDFGRRGTEFWTSWFDHCGDKLNTPEFKAEIDEVVNELRETVLKDRASMRSFCSDFDGELGENFGIRQYGYRIETEHYLYCLRCKPQEGDYDGYLWCYDKRIQEMRQAQREIVGRVSFANGEEIEYTNPDEFIASVKEELPYHATSGFRCETLTDDPQVRKAVDDILYDLYGEQNPRPPEDYEAKPPAMRMEM